MKFCVFGSSSKKTPQKYIDVAYRLGQVIGENGDICVNGAGRFGAMGAASSGCRSKNGKVIGIIHESFVVDNEEDSLIDDLIISRGPDLSERKQLLIDNGDAIIVLPGGVGTFDEMWDAICSKSLSMKNLKNKPISILNADGFYDGSIAQLKRAFEDELLYGDMNSYFHVATTPEEAVSYCKENANGADPILSVFIDRMDVRAAKDVGEITQSI